MLIRTLPTTLLQIFCSIIFNSRVMFKNSLDPDRFLEKHCKHKGKAWEENKVLLPAGSISEASSIYLPHSQSRSRGNYTGSGYSQVIHYCPASNQLSTFLSNVKPFPAKPWQIEQVNSSHMGKIWRKIFHIHTEFQKSSALLILLDTSKNVLR